jgi:hypothetical protein
MWRIAMLLLKLHVDQRGAFATVRWSNAFYGAYNFESKCIIIEMESKCGYAVHS